MRIRHALTVLAVAVSFPAFATDPQPIEPPAPPPKEVARENQPTPLSQPKVEPKKKGSRFVQRRLARPFAGDGTPLVISKTEKISVRAADRTFEFEPGSAVLSAWPDANTAWLVRDLDHDGRITSGRELFGSWTLTDTQNWPENGFEALAALDDDHDGFVTAKDTHFAELRLWFDKDGDRKTDDGELVSLLSTTRLPVKFEVELSCTDRNRTACTYERAKLDDGTWLLDLHLELRVPPVARR